MKRRDLSLLLPALSALRAGGQPATLPSATYRFEDLPVRTNGKNRSRAVLNGIAHKGQSLQVHQTELAPGLPPHPPHSHEHEELLLIREGTLEVTINGKTTLMGPGSVAFAASGDRHGWRNAGDTTAHYFVVTFGR